MDASDLVLLIVASSEGGSVRGRTLLQKTAYFINEIEGLGICYFPHYYGPYSREVAQAVDSLVAVGLLCESRCAFEPRRFDYSLTDAGKEVVRYIVNEDPGAVQGVDRVVGTINSRVGSDYHTLSIAAKSYHILDQERRPMTPNDVSAVADTMGWSIDPRQVLGAFQILRDLDLTREHPG